MLMLAGFRTNTGFGLAFFTIVMLWASHPGLAQLPSRPNVLDESEKVTSEVAVDVVVYGGTPAGIMSAVAAGRAGHRVVLIEPSYLIGGLMSGGLHKTDIGNRDTIGGLSKEFFTRVLDHYTQTYGANSPQVKAVDYQQKPTLRNGFYFEPKIAHQIFRQMLGEAGVSIRIRERLELVNAISGSVTSIVTRNTQTQELSQYKGTIFIDGSYEGDVMAMAGVMYRVGREARAEYNEPLAGITEGPAEYLGKGDHRVQSYNIRSTICVDPNNHVPIPKPKQYYRAEHAHLIKVIKEHGYTRLEQLYPDRNRWAEINGKMDPNKADFIGINTGYSEGDYLQRERIMAKVRDYWLSHWYMLQNDPEIPEAFRKDAQRYGLPKDEYLESDHITPQLYVRVARRMQGRYFLTQHDVRYDRHKPDAICMGSYGTDCHAIQIIQTEHGIEQEGDFNGAADPYEIPYRCITPYGVRNLLVVAAISASHVAYASVRMEPVFMMLGNAGGEAAHLAISDQCAVQDIGIGKLQNKLRSQGIPLEAPYRPLVKIRALTPGPYRAQQPIELEAVADNLRRPLQKMVWNFDGSGAPQAEGMKTHFTFEQPGRYTVMLLAWEDEELFAVPATLDLEVLPSDPNITTSPNSPNREVHYLEARKVGRWSRARGRQIEYRDRVGLLDEGKGDGKSRAEFTTTLPKSGRYRVSIAYATAPNRATNLPVEVQHAGGSTTVRVNQREKTSPFAFTPIGEFRFEADRPTSVIFTNQDADGYILIDTVRWQYLGQ